MFFTAPIWLIGLAPWALAALWLMRRRLPRASVPFLALWETPPAAVAPKPRLAPPPLFIVLLLAALLLLVLAMAGPALSSAGRSAAEAQPPINFIVDRGISMSARQGDVPRYLAAARAASPALAGALGPRREINLLFVPGYPTLPTDLAHWTKDLAALPPTAIETQALLAAAVAQRLRRGRGPVIVLSDQPLEQTNPRLIQIPPADPLHTVGIALLAARESPHPQVMVRLRNQSPQTHAALRIQSAGQSRIVDLTLPPAGQTITQFIELAALGNAVSVHLQSPDALAADDAAWLVRQPGQPLVESRTSLPPELQRMIAVYNQARSAMAPPTPRAAIVTRMTDLPAGQPAVWLGGAGPLTLPAAISPTVHPDPLTANVHWKSILASASLSSPPGAGWTAVVSAGEHLALAVRDAPARQVWVGFTSPTFPRTPDYVIFWKNVFDYLGGETSGFTAQSAGQLNPAWRRINEPAPSSAPAPSAPPDPSASPEPGLWPGLYRRGDGALRAVNAPDFIVPPLPHTPWRDQLAHLSPAEAASIPLARWLELAALALLLAAAAAWPASRLRYSSSTLPPPPVRRGRAGEGV